MNRAACQYPTGDAGKAVCSAGRNGPFQCQSVDWSPSRLYSRARTPRLAEHWGARIMIEAFYLTAKPEDLPDPELLYLYVTPEYDPDTIARYWLPTTTADRATQLGPGETRRRDELSRQARQRAKWGNGRGEAMSDEVRAKRAVQLRAAASGPMPDWLLDDGAFAPLIWETIRLQWELGIGVDEVQTITARALRVIGPDAVMAATSRGQPGRPRRDNATAVWGGKTYFELMCIRMACTRERRGGKRQEIQTYEGRLRYVVLQLRPDLSPVLNEREDSAENRRRRGQLKKQIASLKVFLRPRESRDLHALRSAKRNERSRALLNS